MGETIGVELGRPEPDRFLASVDEVRRRVGKPGLERRLVQGKNGNWVEHVVDPLLLPVLVVRTGQGR